MEYSPQAQSLGTGAWCGCRRGVYNCLPGSVLQVAELRTKLSTVESALGALKCERLRSQSTGGTAQDLWQEELGPSWDCGGVDQALQHRGVWGRVAHLQGST